MILMKWWVDPCLAYCRRTRWLPSQKVNRNGVTDHDSTLLEAYQAQVESSVISEIACMTFVEHATQLPGG